MQLKTYVAAALLSMAVAGSARAVAPLMEYISPVRDLSLKSEIVSRDMDILKKISPEFAQSYRFGSSQLFYKEPNKLKLVSKAGLVNVVYTINGNQKVLKAGFIHRSWDITHTPGQRQTAITIGLMTPSWVDLVNSTFKGKAKVAGRETVVYEAHFKDEPRGTYFKVYLDPDRKVLVRQEQIHGDGKPKVTFNFLDPIQVNGIWVPTKTEVFNGAGERGAVTRISNVKVNSGLGDSTFSL